MSVKLVLSDLTIESIAMNTKDHSGLGLISTGLGKGGLDESFLKLAYGFIKEYPAFDHFRNK
jgi:hypothetical protein